MFEKLKEYALYIILGLIALGALAYAYLNTTNSQKGSDVLSSVQDTLISAVSKNDKVIAKTTVVDHMSDLNGVTIGQYKIDATKAYFVNVDGDTAAIGGNIPQVGASPANVAIFTPTDTTNVGKLGLVLMPNEAVKGISGKVFELASNSVTIDGGTAANNTAWAGTDAENEIMRGFLAYGYVGFGTFANENDAKEFRDSYFSTGITVKNGTANDSLVFVELAR